MARKEFKDLVVGDKIYFLDPEENRIELTGYIQEIEKSEPVKESRHDMGTTTKIEYLFIVTKKENPEKVDKRFYIPVTHSVRDSKLYPSDDYYMNSFKRFDDDIRITKSNKVNIANPDHLLFYYDWYNEVTHKGASYSRSLYYHNPLKESDNNRKREARSYNMSQIDTELEKVQLGFEILTKIKEIVWKENRVKLPNS